MSMESGVSAVHGRVVLDSDGGPALEVEVRLRGGAHGAAIVSMRPRATIGWAHHRMWKGDALVALRQLRDGIAEGLRGCDALDQAAIDRGLSELRLEGAASVAVSLAVAHAAAAHEGRPLWHWLRPSAHVLPVPMITLLESGANALDVRELLVVPWASESVADALHVAVDVHRAMEEVLRELGHSTASGPTGGFAPNVPSVDATLELGEEAIRRAGHHPGEDVCLAVDASADLWRTEDARYRLAAESVTLDTAMLVDHWVELAGYYSIVALEDPLADDDAEGWTKLHDRLGHHVQLIGDGRLGADAVVIEPDRFGTLSEALGAIESGAGVLLAPHRAETEDTTIADLAVGVGAGRLKAGPPCRGEHVAKYNRLMRIEEALGDDALYAGRGPFLPRAGQRS
jgi:enolase